MIKSQQLNSLTKFHPILTPRPSTGLSTDSPIPFSYPYIYWMSPKVNSSQFFYWLSILIVFSFFQITRSHRKWRKSRIASDQDGFGSFCSHKSQRHVCILWWQEEYFLFQNSWKHHRGNSVPKWYFSCRRWFWYFEVKTCLIFLFQTISPIGTKNS